MFDNQWHLVAGTYDGANVRLFVDGVQVGAAKPASGITYAPPITESMFYVDGYPPQAGCIGNFDFPGQIDEVRVYERALSPTELGRLAAAPGPTPPDLAPDANPTPVGPSPVPLSLKLSKVALGSKSALKSGLEVLKLETKGTVEQTKIKIDGKPALTVDPSANYLGLILNQIGKHVITATAGFGGATVTQSTSLQTKASATSRLKFFPDTAVASTTPEILINALKNRECVPNTTVTFGVAEANGCQEGQEAQRQALRPGGSAPGRWVASRAMDRPEIEGPFMGVPAESDSV